MTGGPITPEWPDGDPPRWIDPRLFPSYGMRANGTGHLPYGGNMGVRRGTAIGVGGFRSDLGHVGSRMGLHEDTELAARLMRAGSAVVEVNGRVTHRVRAATLGRRWLLRRAWVEGGSDRRTDQDARAIQLLGHVARAVVLLPMVGIAWFPVPAALYWAARGCVHAGYVAASLTPSRYRRG